MQALKAMVVGMGALIIISLGLLGWGFYSRLAPPAEKAGTAATTDGVATRSVATPAAPVVPPEAGPGASSAAPGFGAARIELPAGCTLAEMHAESGRLFVRTGPEGLCERILVLDPVSGSLLGTFVFRP